MMLYECKKLIFPSFNQNWGFTVSLKLLYMHTIRVSNIILQSLITEKILSSPNTRSIVITLPFFNFSHVEKIFSPHLRAEHLLYPCSFSGLWMNPVTFVLELFVLQSRMEYFCNFNIYFWSLSTFLFSCQPSCYRCKAVLIDRMNLLCM